MGAYSGFSGASCAISSARRTVFSSEASSNSLIVAVPDFFPNTDVTASDRLLASPLVLTELRA